MYQIAQFARRSLFSFTIALGCSLLSNAFVQAGPITLGSSAISGLSNGSTDDTTMGSDLTTALNIAGASITVAGAEVQSNYEQGNPGNNHVVGPVFGTRRDHLYTPWTLGTSSFTYDGNGNLNGLSAPTGSLNPSNTVGYSNFLTNITNGGGTGNSNGFTINLSGFSVSSITFAFEIFPDDTESSTNPADFTLQANATISSKSITSGYDGTRALTAVSSGANYWTVDAIAPGSATGGYTHSLASGARNEASYQLLDFATVNFGGTGATQLQFNDWPATIGVSSLQLTPYSPGPPPPVGSAPAPPSVVLFGFGGIGLAFYLARSRRQLAAAM